MNIDLNKLKEKIENNEEVIARSKTNKNLEFVVSNVVYNGFKLYSTTDHTGSADFKVSTEYLLQNFDIIY